LNLELNRPARAGLVSGVSESIAEDLAQRGLSIQPNALEPEMAHALRSEVTALDNAWFRQAGVGRLKNHHLNRFNRTDSVCWMDGRTDPSAQWIALADQLRLDLNRQLFLGLFSYESHYARYLPGDFYKRHVDAFRGQANRVVSTVLYLNPGWTPEDGGELVIYESAADQTGLRVTPAFGTLVCFLSEEFPHEVLPAQRIRYSIAGWYRLNQTSMDVLDPPR
jgi:Predicted proline hydroxylase